ncbi:hypothetical protein [Legionella sp. CNM-4043-24]|uniref:hypothetical protein n=1 Tax=Legionella sp. CNM-4043-24 TaxID=3421646 RepID=UPI00403B2B97
MAKTPEKPEKKEFNSPEVVEIEAQQSFADSSVPQKPSLQAIRSSLMDNKGMLQSTVYLSSIKILRSMMLNNADDTRQWLSRIVTLKEWRKETLAQFLIDTHVCDTPDEERRSLLRCSLPGFLDIFLSLDDEIVKDLIKDLFFTKDENHKTAIQQLIEDRQFNTLEAIYTRMRTLPVLTEKPEIAATFQDASTDDLLRFAMAKGGYPCGPQFHELVCDDRLLQLNATEMLALIKCLLSPAANSDGLALYQWYIRENRLEADRIAQQLFQEQLQHCGGSYPLDVMQIFLANRDIQTCETAQEFIKSLSPANLVRLVQPILNTALHRHTPTSDKTRAVEKIQAIVQVDPVVIGRRLLENITMERPEQLTRLLLCGSDALIPIVINHYPRGKNRYTYLRDLINSPEYPYSESIKLVSALDSQTAARVLPHCRDSYVEHLAPGTIFFRDIKDYFYKSRDFDCTDRYRVRALKYTNGWDDLTTNAHLMVNDLLDYRAKRMANPLERYRWFGFAGGFSKTAKLAAVDKIFIHIYGTDQDKQASGSFSAQDLEVMSQGELGGLRQRHSAWIQVVINQADVYRQEAEFIHQTPR